MTGLRVNLAATDAGAIRTETFRGQTYTVVPVIALVEGVLQGLNAATPEFAPADEFAKLPLSWDGRPVTLDHPRNNGVLVSANSTEMLEAFQIGFLANTTRDGDKLKTEAWIDNSLVEALGDEAAEMMERINAGEEFVEVSTGLFTDVNKTYGTFNSKSYSLSWQNVVPDHLAFLPNAIGACSVADGCGAPRLNSAGEIVGGVLVSAPVNLGVANAAKPCCQECADKAGEVNMLKDNTHGDGETRSESGLRDAAGSDASPEAGNGSASTGSEPSGAEDAGAAGNQEAEPTGPSMTVETQTLEDGIATKTTVTGTPEEVAAALAANEERAETFDRIVANSVPAGMTFENIRTIMQDAIRTRWPHDTSCYDCCYYSSYVVALTSDMVAFEHRENGVYTNVAVGYTMDENGGVTFAGEPVPVNLIISIVPKPETTLSANSDGSEEGETSGANQQQEESQMADEATQGESTETTTPAGGETRANGAGDTPVQFRTHEEYLATLPEDMREMFQEGMDLRVHKRAKLVESIKANASGVFTDKELEGKTMRELEQLNTLATPPASFEGRAVPGGRAIGINANSQQRDNQNTVPAAPKAFGKATIGRDGRTIADVAGATTSDASVS